MSEFLLTDEQQREEKKKRDLLKQLICEVVYEYKHKNSLDSASSIIINNNITFEDIVNSTVKLNINNVAVLADRVISLKQ